jgi:Leucine-rich repeat (LRR) protein
MKRIATLALILFCLTAGSYAQKLTKEEVARYDNEVRTLVNYLEETLNFIGDSTTSAQEKGIVFTESWSKIFVDDKVQVEDDLDVNRKTPINKDVQAYLKDIDFFFKWVTFKFDVQSISNNVRDDGSIFFKVTLSRHLTARTINDEPVDDMRNRFIEINLDKQKSSIKIASIYTSKINEKEMLRNWWNSLSMNWKNRLAGDIKLYESIPLSSVSMISDVDFVASYPVMDSVTGETVLRDKIFKDDMSELDAKLKQVTQRQRVDLSGILGIIDVEPVSELSDLIWLDISGTSVEDISPLRNANKLKTLRANSTLIDDLSPLKYCLTLEELEVANATIDDLSVLENLPNLQKINLSGTDVSRINGLKNCPNLTTLNLSGTRISNIGIVQDLPLLKNLDISNTAVRDLSPVASLKDLQSLNISGSAITHLQALSELENLRELYCSNTSINNLTPLKNQRRLSKIYCDQSGIGVAEASDFSKSNPFTLVIYDTKALRNWWDELPMYWKAVFSKQIQLDTHPTTEQLHEIINMQELDLSGNTFLQNLMPVSRLTNLRSLNIAHTEIGFLQPIQNLANLESLNISHTYINSIEPLKEMSNLKQLNISNTPITDITPLANDNSIEVIVADSTGIGETQIVALKERQRQVHVIYQTEALMTWWRSLNPIWQAIFRNALGIQEDTPSALDLQRVADIRELEIGIEYPIGDLEPLAHCLWLERLTINGQSVHDIEPLANKEYLVELNVQNNPISSLKPIEGSANLELLNIENTQVKDLGPLSKMNNLVTLNAAGTPVKVLKPLANLMSLENLFVNNTDIRSLAPVEGITTLRQLKVYNTKVRKRDVEKLQQKRLDLNIVYY